MRAADAVVFTRCLIFKGCNQGSADSLRIIIIFARKLTLGTQNSLVDTVTVCILFLIITVRKPLCRALHVFGGLGVVEEGVIDFQSFRIGGLQFNITLLTHSRNEIGISPVVDKLVKTDDVGLISHDERKLILVAGGRVELCAVAPVASPSILQNHTNLARLFGKHLASVGSFCVAGITQSNLARHKGLLYKVICSSDKAECIRSKNIQAVVFHLQFIRTRCHSFDLLGDDLVSVCLGGGTRLAGKKNTALTVNMILQGDDGIYRRIGRDQGIYEGEKIGIVLLDHLHNALAVKHARSIVKNRPGSAISGLAALCFNKVGGYGVADSAHGGKVNLLRQRHQVRAAKVLCLVFDQAAVLHTRQCLIVFVCLNCVFSGLCFAVGGYDLNTRLKVIGALGGNDKAKCIIIASCRGLLNAHVLGRFGICCVDCGKLQNGLISGVCRKLIGGHTVLTGGEHGVNITPATRYLCIGESRTHQAGVGSGVDCTRIAICLRIEVARVNLFGAKIVLGIFGSYGIAVLHRARTASRTVSCVSRNTAKAYQTVGSRIAVVIEGNVKLLLQVVAIGVDHHGACRCVVVTNDTANGNTVRA